MQDQKPSTESFNIRLPAGMRDRIKARADENGRSMNAEICTQLEQIYPDQPLDLGALDSLLDYIASAPSAADAIARVNEINARFADMGSGVQITRKSTGQILVYRSA